MDWVRSSLRRALHFSGNRDLSLRVGARAPRALDRVRLGASESFL